MEPPSVPPLDAALLDTLEHTLEPPSEPPLKPTSEPPSKHPYPVHQRKKRRTRRGRRSSRRPTFLGQSWQDIKPEDERLPSPSPSTEVMNAVAFPVTTLVPTEPERLQSPSIDETIASLPIRAVIDPTHTNREGPSVRKTATVAAPSLSPCSRYHAPSSSIVYTQCSVDREEKMFAPKAALSYPSSEPAIVVSWAKAAIRYPSAEPAIVVSWAKKATDFLTPAAALNPIDTFTDSTPSSAEGRLHSCEKCMVSYRTMSTNKMRHLCDGCMASRNRLRGQLANARRRRRAIQTRLLESNENIQLLTSKLMKYAR